MNNQYRKPLSNLTHSNHMEWFEKQPEYKLLMNHNEALTICTVESGVRYDFIDYKSVETILCNIIFAFYINEYKEVVYWLINDVGDNYLYAHYTHNEDVRLLELPSVPYIDKSNLEQQKINCKLQNITVESIIKNQQKYE